MMLSLRRNQIPELMIIKIYCKSSPEENDSFFFLSSFFVLQNFQISQTKKINIKNKVKKLCCKIYSHKKVAKKITTRAKRLRILLK